jgi:glycosyltransferase involved in cell wall biosynthesis
MPSEHQDKSVAGAPSVAILLCTLRAHDYLRQQLDSIVGQTHTSWSIWVSDDGSDQSTHTILGEYQTRLGSSRFNILRGPAQGFAANFLSLACNTSVSADYYAYADQDDIWESDKLALALRWLEGMTADVAALYCARTRKVDQDNQEIGFSRRWTRPPSFANALVQNIASGNTMVFNQAARRLLCIAGPDLDVPAHDWWTYLLVSACGGCVHYDATPTVRYRMHERNLIGANRHLSQRLRHWRALLGGRPRYWNQLNVQALQAMQTYLDADAQYRLEQFSRARNANLWNRTIAIARSGAYRQSILGSIGVVIAVLFKRL